MKTKIIIGHLLIVVFSSCFLCNNMQAQNTKKNKQTTTIDPLQIQCEQRYKDGKTAYDAGNYQEALIFFKKGLQENCKNVDFADYIELCNIKIEKQRETEQNCNKFLSDGKDAYNSNRYELAKTHFNQGLTNNCSNSEFQIWINKCDEKISEANAALNVSATTVEFDAAGGSKTISINTMSLWNVTSIISWFSVSKYSNTVVITCNANFNADDRSDYFNIFTNSKTIQITIKQKGVQSFQTPPNPITETQRLILMNMNSNPTSSFENGKYKGQKNIDNQRSGLGAYNWNDGNFYFGDFYNSARTGKGIQMIFRDGYYLPNCSNCKYYVGDWSNSKKSGRGICYDMDGRLIYLGEFVDDRPTETYPTTGNWTRNYKFDIIEYDSGDRYIGETLNGNQHGYGIYFGIKGNMWYGQWENGKRNGKGILINMNGEMTAGTWKADTLQ
jgi:hypothetical protein